MKLPIYALSIRQPWAWAIVHAGKDIENRIWRRPNPALDFRGEFAVHASQLLTRSEYDQAVLYMRRIGVTCPPAAELPRGGIVGIARVTDMLRVREHPSPWFMGPLGLLLDRQQPCAFIPAKGALGFFAWRPGDPADVPTPAAWMVRAAVPSFDLKQSEAVLEPNPQRTLL